MGYIYTYDANLPWYDYSCEKGKSGPKGYVCQISTANYWGKWSSWSDCTSDNDRKVRNRCIAPARGGPKQCSPSETKTNETCCSVESNCTITYTTRKTTTTRETFTTYSATGQPSTGADTKFTNIGESTTYVDDSFPLLAVACGGGGGLLLVIIIMISIVACRAKQRKEARNIAKGATELNIVTNGSVNDTTAYSSLQNQEEGINRDGTSKRVNKDTEPTVEHEEARGKLVLNGVGKVQNANETYSSLQRDSGRTTLQKSANIQATVTAETDNTYSALSRENVVPQANEASTSSQADLYSIPEAAQRPTPGNRYSNLKRDPSVIASNDTYSTMQGNSQPHIKDEYPASQTDIYTIPEEGPQRPTPGMAYSILGRDPSIMVTNDTYSTVTQHEGPKPHIERDNPALQADLYSIPDVKKGLQKPTPANEYSSLNTDPSAVVSNDTYSSLREGSQPLAEGVCSSSQAELYSIPEVKQGQQRSAPDNGYSSLKRGPSVIVPNDTYSMRQKILQPQASPAISEPMRNEAYDNSYDTFGAHEKQTSESDIPYNVAATPEAAPNRILSDGHGELYTMVQRP